MRFKIYFIDYAFNIGFVIFLNEQNELTIGLTIFIEKVVCVANPLLKWQRVTLILRFVHILHDCYLRFQGFLY